METKVLNVSSLDSLFHPSNSCALYKVNQNSPPIFFRSSCTVKFGLHSYLNHPIKTSALVHHLKIVHFSKTNKIRFQSIPRAQFGNRNVEVSSEEGNEETTKGNGTLENLVTNDENIEKEMEHSKTDSSPSPSPPPSSPPPSEKEELSRSTLIWRAIKLPIYSVALIPLMVGAGAAYYHTRSFDAIKFFQYLFSSVLVIAWLNLSNDAYDSETGVDVGKKESVVNLTGSRSFVLMSAYVCLFLGLAGILHGMIVSDDVRILTLLLAAIACGYVYQCPPFRLSYKGLGEPLCFFAFGPFATSAFFLHQMSSVVKRSIISNTALCASVLVGITTTLILFCSHFHQIEGDLKVGKYSPLVRMGSLLSSKILKFSVFSLYLLSFAFVFSGCLPVSCLIAPILTSPIGLLVVNYVKKNYDNNSLIFMAKYYCVRLHVAFGLTLALGLALGTTKPAMLLQPA